MRIKNIPEQPRKPPNEQKKKERPYRQKLVRNSRNLTRTPQVKDISQNNSSHKALELLYSFIKKDENKGRVQIDHCKNNSRSYFHFSNKQLKLNFRLYQNLL
ncbi:Hypothetical_protein [Hexamita inflata]|uniref:Hypothetical_protein n=1 Tax=Hexamita inflata TaxID=28002 RepID=A0AA86PA13_9EUKA|nr:Hypothetical protein HINF_LOCUS7997 [Hexamita inflata]CAI9932599.1 Hypothetical protein HINF_LOCUS20244 [Hexamita inflata]